MDLHPWRLWHSDGTPEEGTLEIVAVLESVLRRDPNHIGANHYYIHAVEGSWNPDRALPSAERLPKLAPAQGHLVHMPAHIYVRTGDFASAIRVNEAAVKADQTYIRCCGPMGMYPAIYANHNIHFIAVFAAMAGDSKKTLAAAKQLELSAIDSTRDVPFAEPFIHVRPLMLARFNLWDEILKSKSPDPAHKSTVAMWHFARACALAAKGKHAEAAAESAAFDAAAKNAPGIIIGNNSSDTVLPIARRVLNSRLARGKKDAAGEVAELKAAIVLQDKLVYDEPPSWPTPLRESLGAALLRSGDAGAAESAFREDLKRNRGNGRSLFGLAKALEAQGRNAEAAAAMAEFKKAWKGADVVLTIGDF